MPERIDPMFGQQKNKYIKGHKPEGKYIDTYLNKEDYESPMLNVYRLFKDDGVFGKKNFDLYCNPMKPEHLDQEFGGVPKKFKANCT